MVGFGLGKEMRVPNNPSPNATTGPLPVERHRVWTGKRLNLPVWRLDVKQCTRLTLDDEHKLRVQQTF